MVNETTYTFLERFLQGDYQGLNVYRQFELPQMEFLLEAGRDARCEKKLTR